MNDISTFSRQYNILEVVLCINTVRDCVQLNETCSLINLT